MPLEVPEGGQTDEFKDDGDTDKEESTTERMEQWTEQQTSSLGIHPEESAANPTQQPVQQGTLPLDLHLLAVPGNNLPGGEDDIPGRGQHGPSSEGLSKLKLEQAEQHRMEQSTGRIGDPPGLSNCSGSGQESQVNSCSVDVSSTIHM